jgi:hypothetical protein
MLRPQLCGVAAGFAERAPARFFLPQHKSTTGGRQGKGVGSRAVYSISASTIPVAINGTCATISASGFMTLVGP